VSKSGAEKLQNLIEEYKTLKELDPQDSILKRYISEYKKNLKKELGVVPKTLVDVKAMSSNGPKAVTVSKDFGINQMIAYLDGLGSFTRKLLESANVDAEIIKSLREATNSSLNLNFFNNNYPTDGTYVGSSIYENIAVYVYFQDNFFSKACTINVSEINPQPQGVQRGLILAYTYAISELKEKKGAMNAYPQTTKKEYIQTALEQGEPQGVRGDIGWGTVTKVSNKGGLITSVTVKLKDGRIRTYNKNSKNDALLRTLYDIINQDALPEPEIGFAHSTIESMGKNYSALDEEYSSSEKRQAQRSQYKDLLKLADFFDERGMQDKADCIDKIIYKLKR
jgi:hypothetical protein